MSFVSYSSSSTYLPSTIPSHRHGSYLNLTRLLHTTRTLSFPTTNSKTKTPHITTSRDMDMAIYSGHDGFGSPLPPPPKTPWPLWVAGVLMPAILFIWKTKNNWRSLLMFKQKVEDVVDAVEEVAEMVETAAEKVVKMAEETAEHLPEGSKLQKAALFVENAAERIAKDADFAGDIIDKGEKMYEDLNSFLNQNGGSKEEEEHPKQKNDQTDAPTKEAIKEQPIK